MYLKTAKRACMDPYFFPLQKLFYKFMSKVIKKENNGA